MLRFNTVFCNAFVEKKKKNSGKMIQNIMKIFRKTIQEIVIQSGTILKTVLFSVTIFILGTAPAYAQGKLTGYVVDEEFNEPLEKAVVTIPGTLISVLTDQQGKYSLNLTGGEYALEVNHPGYFRKFYNISVSSGISTPMFIVKLKANATGRSQQRHITSFENKRQSPQATENLSTWAVAEQTGRQEFNEIFRAIPSVNFLSRGNGFNDSGIGFRGNDPSRTSYTFNGILLNNPETGLTGPSILSGLTDWAGQIQVVTGQASNMHSQTSSGGLINVLSFVPHEKFGVEALAVYGNDGFLKTSATVHTGLSRKGFSSSVQLSRTAGNGMVQNTAFEQYGFFVNIRSILNPRHTLDLNLNGILQQHDRNNPDSINAYNRYGQKYNPEWGYLIEKPMSLSTNFGISPLIGLTHFWQVRQHTQITTQIFAQLNRSAQLYPDGLFNNQPFNNLPRAPEGWLPMDLIAAWNNGLPADGMGAVRQPDENDRFINSVKSGISVLAAINRENRFGLRSVLTHEFSKNLDLSGSIDFEQYHAGHFAAVSDILSAEGYADFSDVNQVSGLNVKTLFQPVFYPSFTSPDKTNYYYESGIQSGGINLGLNYELSRLYFYMEGAASIQNIRRTDHFSYLTTDPDRQTKPVQLPGTRIQSGFRYNLWNYHSIHVKAGYGTYQPLFTVLFPSGNNWKNQEATNEQVFDAEAGYTLLSRKLKVEALVYRSQVTNRSMVRHSNLKPGDSYGLVNGLAELHQGVELKTMCKINRNFQFSLNGTYSNRKYTKDAAAVLYDSGNQATATNDLWLKDVHPANAPQISIFAEAEYRLAHNFYFRINYYRAEQIYALFSLYDFKNLTDRSDFVQWKMPKYDLIGVSGNYLLQVMKKYSINLIFGANNLLDSEFIQESLTNLDVKNIRFSGNRVYNEPGRTWYAGVKFQF